MDPNDQTVFHLMKDLDECENVRMGLLNSLVQVGVPTLKMVVHPRTSGLVMVLQPGPERGVVINPGPKMMFDSDRVNLDSHINDTGLLINTNHPEWSRMKAVHTSGKVLKNYSGTCSTSPLPSSGLVYWEVEADVELDEPLGDAHIVLEVGVCGEDVMDSNFYIGGQSNSGSLYIYNVENDVKLYITINGKHVAQSKVFENKAGTSVTVKYGVLVDTDKMAVVFLDTANKEVLGYGCIGDKKPQHGAGYNRKIWPVFAVYLCPKRVEIKLVSVTDVQMEDWKKKLIEDAIRICENQLYGYSRSSRTTGRHRDH